MKKPGRGAIPGRDSDQDYKESIRSELTGPIGDVTAHDIKELHDA